MINYVAGFLLNQDLTRVALIQKNKGPNNMAGLLNGIGGKVEPGETTHAAMRREFKEETGIDTDVSPIWRPFCYLSNSAAWADCWVCTFYVARSNRVYEVKTMETEPVSVYGVHELPTLPVVPNVRWILPMALSFERGEYKEPYIVEERA